MTQVFINGNEIDVDQDTVVAAWYGNVSFGELGKRKGARTNNWVAPFSNKNRSAFDGCDQVSSWSNVVYRRGTISVLVDGTEVFQGWTIVNEAEEGFNIQSFATASDFYSQITTKKLRVLDLSQYSHVWSEAVVKNSWNNTSGYNYAFVEYGKEWPFSLIPVNYLLPQIFFKDVVKAIAADAGYTLYGDVLSDPLYQKHVVIPNTYPLPYSYGAASINLALYLPDLLQSKLWLDFGNIYGLQFDIDDEVKEIRCNYLDDLLFNEAEDWSSKVDATDKKKITYRFKDYGQTSYLAYKEYNEQGQQFGDFAKSVAIDDTVLKDSADIYRSEFYLIANLSAPTVWQTYTYLAKLGFSGIWKVGTTYIAGGGVNTVYRNGTYYKAIEDSTGEDPALSPAFWEVVKESDVFNITSRPMYGTLEVDPGFYIEVDLSTGPEIITRKITNRGLTWPELYPKYYRVFSKVIQRTKIVDMLLKLNRSDINQLDFTRLKQIDGELYVLQSIDEYKLNYVDSTQVNLVRL